MSSRREGYESRSFRCGGSHDRRKNRRISFGWVRNSIRLQLEDVFWRNQGDQRKRKLEYQTYLMNYVSCMVEQSKRLRLHNKTDGRSDTQGLLLVGERTEKILRNGWTLFFYEQGGKVFLHIKSYWFVGIYYSLSRRNVFFRSMIYIFLTVLIFWCSTVQDYFVN